MELRSSERKNANIGALTKLDVNASDPWHLPNLSVGYVRGLLI